MNDSLEPLIIYGAIAVLAVPGIIAIWVWRKIKAKREYRLTPLKNKISLIGTKFLGAIGLATGLFLLGWFSYNQFYPTESFKSGYRSILQLVFPIVCLISGWKAIFYKGKSIEDVTPNFDSSKAEEAQRAKEKARNQLHQFIKEVKKNTLVTMINFPWNVDGEIIEIWAMFISTKMKNST